MRLYSFRLVTYLFCVVWFLVGCTHPAAKNQGKTVYVRFNNSAYTLMRNGKPFMVKGAAGFTNLKRLHDVGGNTIRVWDTLHLAQILDSAQANQLAVMVGIELPGNNNMDAFYNNDAKVKAGYEKIAATVKRYKDHPALLCWCLGNELSFPLKPKYNAFYSAFNELTDLIHTLDPNHPVTTTMMTFKKKEVFDMSLRTHVDFISFNLFGALQELNKNLADAGWFWKGPFLITEWGIEGPWIPTEQNAWGAFIENTSQKKAEQYLQAYQQYMPVNNPRYLGSMVFYWGQKEELTPTWFSLFDEQGAQTETVSALQYIWTGYRPATHAPEVKYMLIDGKGARDNILYNPGDNATAQVLMASSGASKLHYKWRLIAEDWYKPNGIFNEKKPIELKDFIVNDKGEYLEFKTPAKEGPYRLLAYIYDDNGQFATCNTPFYVIDHPYAR